MMYFCSEQYSAQQVAYLIINESVRTRNYVSNLTLQHILYHVQRIYINIYQKRLFDDEMQAWVWGSCVPNVYDEFYLFGANDIWEVDSVKLIKCKTKDELLIRMITNVYNKQKTWDMCSYIHSRKDIEWGSKQKVWFLTKDKNWI